MTATLLAISAAYVVIGVLLLSMGLTSRFAWWVKAAAIVVTSLFFVEVFFATKGLLGWPRHRAAAGPVPIAVDAGGRARSEDRRSRRDLPLGRGARREQRARRHAALLSAALFAAAGRPVAQGARRDHVAAIRRRAPPTISPEADEQPKIKSDDKRPRSRSRSQREPRSTSDRVHGCCNRRSGVEFRPMPVPTLPPKQ